MTKIWKNTLNSIIVLLVVSFCSVLAVLLFNYVLPPKNTFYDKAKLQQICDANEYKLLTADELGDLDVDLDTFNSTFAYASVRSVFLAVGGANDGRFIIEAEGLGFRDTFAVILYISYDADGKIMGVTDLFVDMGNTYWNSHIRSSLPQIYQNLIGQSGDVGSGNSLMSSTNATQSMNGIARAVNIANALIPKLLGTSSNDPYEVTETRVLNRLRAITESGLSFTAYPYAIFETINNFPAQINTVYISENNHYIFEAKCEAGGFGSATLLVLVDIDTHTIIAINPVSLSVSNSPEHGITTEFLYDRLQLTQMFKDKSIEDIESMDKYLTGATGATETANGIKTALIMALRSIDGFIDYLGESQSQNQGGVQ